MLDRSKINTCLSKAIAFKQCGNREDLAREWARELIRQLDLADILPPEHRRGEG